MSYNQQMHSKNLAHTHYGILLGYKKNEIMNIAGMWMELEKIVLSKVTQI